MWSDLDILIAESEYETSMSVIRRFYEIMSKQLKNGRKIFICNEMSDALSKVGINEGLFKSRLRKFNTSKNDGSFEDFMQFYYEKN